MTTFVDTTLIAPLIVGLRAAASTASPHAAAGVTAAADALVAALAAAPPISEEELGSSQGNTVGWHGPSGSGLIGPDVNLSVGASGDSVRLVVDDLVWSISPSVDDPDLALSAGSLPTDIDSLLDIGRRRIGQAARRAGNAAGVGNRLIRIGTLDGTMIAEYEDGPTGRGDLRAVPDDLFAGTDSELGQDFDDDLDVDDSGTSVGGGVPMTAVISAALAAHRLQRSARAKRRTDTEAARVEQRRQTEQPSSEPTWEPAEQGSPRPHARPPGPSNPSSTPGPPPAQDERPWWND